VCFLFFGPIRLPGTKVWQNFIKDIPKSLPSWNVTEKLDLRFFVFSSYFDYSSKAKNKKKQNARRERRKEP
jgi:hypothetical protein